MQPANFTLAERLVAVQQRNSSKIFREEMQPVLSALCGTGLPDDKLPVQRFRYLDPIAEAVQRTRGISDKEILKALFDVELPCGTFWMEGAAVNSYRMLKDNGDWAAYPDCSRGFLCSLAGEDEIHLRAVTEMPAYLVEQLIKQRLSPEWCLNGKHVPGVETIIVTRDTINVQLSDEARKENYERLTGLRNNEATALSASSADGARHHASFFARTVVLLGAMAADDSPWRMADNAVARREEFKLNLKRRKLGSKIVSMPAETVTIDLAKLTAQHAAKPAKTMRDLFGKTWVKRSRPWRCHKTHKKLTNKDGKEIRTRAHERRIAAPEDRTLSTRELTVSRPVTLDLSGDYPALKV